MTRFFQGQAVRARVMLLCCYCDNFLRWPAADLKRTHSNTWPLLLPSCVRWAPPRPQPIRNRAELYVHFDTNCIVSTYRILLQGQFIEVQVTDGALYRTKIHCYFLDQTRVIRPLPGEKNYHIFYQILAGLSSEERAKLNLEGCSPSTLKYLQNGDTRQNVAEDSSRCYNF